MLPWFSQSQCFVVVHKQLLVQQSRGQIFIFSVFRWGLIIAGLSHPLDTTCSCPLKLLQA